MDKILVLDFGGQYNQLIARRVRSLSVYAEIINYDRITVDEIRNRKYKGIILTGGPNSVNDTNSPRYSKDILSLHIPILGICYGHQLLSCLSGGAVSHAQRNSEYGKTTLYTTDSILFDEIPNTITSWMSHTDYVSIVPEGFKVIAKTDNCEVSAIENKDKLLFGVQFHPEVTHTEYGINIISNFIFKICKANPDWKMDDFIQSSIKKYSTELKGEKVLLALSGGVDSSVLAVLLNKAIGDNLICIFVDHGLLRKNESDYVYNLFKDKFNLNIIRIDAKTRFLEKLKGVVSPEEKRKIIGKEFIEVFNDAKKDLGEIKYLSQGTIYPDIIESGNNSSSVIKSHHNVGGLPKDTGFKEIIEPLKYLFKDEVREIGRRLGLPEKIVYRQPFPGPGLAVRIIGEITEEKLEIELEADSILREEFKKHNLEKDASQYFTVLLNTHSVGVMGDDRTYGYTVAIRSVTTDDFMTATWTRIPYDVLEIVSSRITNEVKGVNRIVYDITSKPPATVEWE